MIDDYHLFERPATGEPLPPEIALITAYLARELSPLQIIAVEDRLATDRAFQAAVQPVIDAWSLPGALATSRRPPPARAPRLTRAQLDAAWNIHLAKREHPRSSPVAAVATYDAPSPKRKRSMARIAAIVTATAVPLVLAAQVARYVAGRAAERRSKAEQAASRSFPVSDHQQARPLVVAPRDAQSGPDTLLIDGTAPSCVRCSLVVSAPVRLGATTDRQVPRRVPAMVRDSRGVTYLTFDGWVNQPILRYDSAGTFLGALGRYGRAPGEYEMTFGVFVGPADSLYVWAEGRMQVFSGDGVYRRAVTTLRPRRPFGVSHDGTLYGVTGDLYADRRFGFRMSGDGTVRDSFPLFTGLTGYASRVSNGVVEPPSASFEPAHPVVAPDGSVWTYMWLNYRLEHHAPDGTPRQLFGVQIPGVASPVMTAAQAESLVAQGKRGVPQYVGGGTTPKPRIFAAVDRDGLVWVLRTVAAPKSDTVTFTPIRGAANEAPDERRIPRAVEDRLYHTFVEVIDPKTSSIIARTELPFLGILAAPGYVGRVTADNAGRYLASMYRLTLKH